jgi:hypothetical protein
MGFSAPEWRKATVEARAEQGYRAFLLISMVHRPTPYSFPSWRADLDKGAELLLSQEAIAAEEFPPIHKMEPPKTSVSPTAVKV